MEQFQTFDTTAIQVRSVLNFMYTIGYTLDKESTSGRFVTEASFGQGNRYIGAANAVRLHNSTVEDWELVQGIAFHKTVKFQAGFNPLGIHLAMASKLVEQAKFRIERTGQLVIQDVMIKPLNKVVSILVGDE